jgi:hypothetical protein
METQKGALEIKMPRSAISLTCGCNPYYDIELVHLDEEGKDESSSQIARVGIQKRKIGYTIDEFFYRSGKARDVGFSFTAKGADQGAYKRVVKLAADLSSNLASKINYDCPIQEVRDLSREDISSLLERILEVPKGLEVDKGAMEEMYKTVINKFENRGFY